MISRRQVVVVIVRPYLWVRLGGTSSVTKYLLNKISQPQLLLSTDLLAVHFCDQ